MTTRVGLTARDRKRGMTVGELRSWLESVALLEISDEAPVKVDAGFNSQLKSIDVR